MRARSEAAVRFSRRRGGPNRVAELVLVGPLPPPQTGQAVAFEMLVEAVRELPVHVHVIDLSHGLGAELGAKRPAWSRLADYAFILIRYLGAAAFGRKTVYLTIAQSRRGFLRDLPMIWIARLFRHPVVAHLHGGNYANFYRHQPRWCRFLVRHTLRQTRVLVVLGERLRSLFDFDAALSEKVRIVPNGLPRRADPESRPKRLPTSPEAHVNVLYLSNLLESKGYLDVLEAMRLLVNERGMTNVHCDFCGAFAENPSDDPRARGARSARDRFFDFVTEHDLDANVAFRGTVVGAEKERLLHEAHFFVLPTNYDNEGQPISIIEAIANGTVVISTDYRAIPDMVEDGVSGCLVSYGAAEEIADAVQRLIQTPDLYCEMSRAALEHFRRGFTREMHLQRMLTVLACSDERVIADAVETGP